MTLTGPARFVFLVLPLAAALFARMASAQGIQYPKQTDLPNPYQLVANWPTVPQSMNGGKWGELIRADIDPLEAIAQPSVRRS